MVDFEEDFNKEKKNIKVLFRIFRGEDISEEKKDWDINIHFQIKTWLRNGYLPIETWSVIEKEILGWAIKVSEESIVYVFMCPERKEILFIPHDEIYRFMLDHKADNSESIRCRHCNKVFSLPVFKGDGIKVQQVQYTYRKRGWPGGYHSAMVQVEPRVFLNMEAKINEPVVQSLLF